LNPDELLNQDIKSNSVGRRRAKDKAELVKNVRDTAEPPEKALDCSEVFPRATCSIRSLKC
jgi:hypothetical protein